MTSSKLERAFGDIKQGSVRPAYAQRAGLLAAKIFYDGNRPMPPKPLLPGWLKNPAMKGSVRLLNFG